MAEVSFVATLIAACGGADTVVQAPLHKHLLPRHARATARASDAGPQTDAGEAAPKQLIVMPLSAPDVLLYQDELEAVRAHIVQRIASLESDVLTPWSDDKMRALTDRVSAGKLQENGPICARPPTLTQVVDAETNGGTNDNLLIATPSLDCVGKEECMIQVTIGALEGEREADLMLSAKVAATGSPNPVDGWLAAADALDEVEELIGLGRCGTMDPAPPLVRASLRQTFGDFGATFTPSSPAAALATCHDTTLKDLFHSYQTLLSVDASGHAAKCAVLHDYRQTDAVSSKHEACICQAMEKTKFPADANAAKNKANGDMRRALFEVVDSAPPRKHAHKGNVDARINVLDGAGHPEANDVLDIPQLGDCFVDSNPKDDLTFDMKLHLAPTGKVEAVEIATVPNQMRACLTRAYLATPFTCDMDGQSRVLDVGVTLALRGIYAGKKAPNEDDNDPSKVHN
jgi:hypothetical protein